MAPATKEFFSSTKFAIAGASQDPKKIGNKVSNPLQDLVGVQQQRGGKTSSRDLVERQLALIEAEKRQRCGVHYCDVVKWYKEHGFDAVPIHPKESSVEEIGTVASVFDLAEAKETSLSVITPPKVSLPIVKTSLLELGIPWIWLQPGAEDDDLKDWVESLPDEDLKKRVIYGGPCILVEGEELAKAEGKL